MHLHSMYVHHEDPDRSIRFEVNLLAPTALNHIKFIQYVTVKFDGVTAEVSRMVRNGRYRYGTASVRFPESTFASAKAFCDAKLMDNGAPTHAFHHELERADLPAAVDRSMLWEMEGVPNNPFERVRA